MDCGHRASTHHASLIRALLTLEEHCIARVALGALFGVGVGELQKTHLSAHVTWLNSLQDARVRCKVRVFSPASSCLPAAVHR